MGSRNVFTEEGRTRWRNFGLRLWSYLLLLFALGAVAGAFVFMKLTKGGMGPLQGLYFRQYVKSSALSLALPTRPSKYVLLVSDQSGRRIGVTDQLVYPVKDGQGRGVRDGYGWLFKPYSSARIEQPRWTLVRFRNGDMEGWFRANIYGGKSLPALFVPALITCLIVTVIGTAAAVTVDQRFNRKYEEGKRVRGNRLVDPGEYDREVKDADGLALVVKSMAPEGGVKKMVRRVTKSDEPAWKLRMRRSEEAQGLLILGDTGSGKSQFIHQLLGQIAERESETAVIYDPACEFVKVHYRPERGDVILNPLDNRSPFWSPAFERKYRTDCQLLAEVFFPGRKRMNENEAFFLSAARDILAKLLECDPHPAQLVEWLSNPAEIDRICEGTELANYIGPKAANQRGGVLGSLSKLGKTLRLLPQGNECKRKFSLTEWASKRRGWIFLTSTKEAEEQLRPLYAAYLDLLMRRLMSVDDAWGRLHPVKLIVDEVHSLEYLPTLEKVLTEGRKFGVNTFLGTQNKHQIDDRYGRDAASTMLSSPRYKIVLRCNEPDSAEWLSRLLGDEELEKPRTGVTASVSDQGRDSINYSSYTERRPVVSKEEISNLPDLAGYWKYGELVVPFRCDFIARKQVANGFVPRQSLTPAPVAAKAGKQEIKPVEAAETVHREPETEETKPAQEQQTAPAEPIESTLQGMETEPAQERQDAPDESEESVSAEPTPSSAQDWT